MASARKDKISEGIVGVEGQLRNDNCSVFVKHDRTVAPTFVTGRSHRVLLGVFMPHNATRNRKKKALGVARGA